MKLSDGVFNLTDQMPKKKYSAIQNYLRKINQIKKDTQIQTSSKRTNHFSHSNFLISSSELNRTSDNQTIQQRTNTRIRDKKRCFSMKSQALPDYPMPSNKKKLNTLYNQKFNQTNLNIGQSLFKPSIQNHPQNQTQIQNHSHKTFYQTKLTFYQEKSTFNQTKPTFNQAKPSKRIVTQPNETFYSAFDSKPINNTFSQRKVQRKDSFKKIQTAKKYIYQKIQLYVKDLDQKGEDELNQMLTNQYRKRIRFHNDAYRYEQKIREMIKTNKQIVKLLKQELLTQNTNTYSERVNLSQPYLLVDNHSLSPDKNIILDSIQADFEDSQKKQTSQFQTSHAHCEPNEYPESKQDLHNSISKITEKQDYKDRDYQNELDHVTKQFQSEWAKSQTHKKTLYQKFRSTIFQNYPQIRKRQRSIRKNINAKISLSPSSSEDQISSNHFQPNSNKNSHIQPKKQFDIKPSQIISRKISVTQKAQASPSKSNPRQSLSNTCGGQGKQNLQKTVKLSKKNSISKGSSRVLNLLQSEDKKQVARINFKNLIDFIFKRAFFYSVSKKKIIQNKVPFGKMKYVPPVQKKDLSISFMQYNKSKKEKNYLKTQKLNQKKLRATGNFLIKNKYKIMDIEKEGKKSCEFLLKCLEDAVEDYLKGAKSK